MRFLYVISFVVLCGVIDMVTGKEGRLTGLQYDTKVYPGQDILTTKTPIENGQDITWNKSFGTGVLYFAAEAQFKRHNELKNVTLGWDRKLDMCEERKDLSLSDVVGQVLRISWLPTDHCPVEKGTDRLRNPFGPTVTEVPKVFDTHQYVVKVDVGYSETELVFSTTYDIDVVRV